MWGLTTEVQVAGWVEGDKGGQWDNWNRIHNKHLKKNLLICCAMFLIMLEDKGQVGVVMSLNQVRATCGTEKKTLGLAAGNLGLSLGLLLTGWIMIGKILPLFEHRFPHL